MKYQKLYAGLAALIMTIGVNQAFVANDYYSFSLFGNTTTTTPVIPKNNNNSIKVALLLDTSGSMNGLIEQAKSQLWQILNQLAITEKEGEEETNLEIALYEYGNPKRARGSKQIRKLSAFTTDMDFISEKLFALTTGGGQENCGEIIWTSLDELEWGQNDNDLKMIYIAGNEPFTQGPVNYAEACQKAKKEGVVVNTIFCGNWQEGVQTLWKQGAELAEGEYMNIDHNKATTYIETPYDDKINDLNTKLNKTYIPYGKKGKQKLENQTMQDSNAGKYSKANSADRAMFKTSKKYKAEDWDLVDAYKKDKKVLKKAKVMDENLQNISAEELEAKIQAITAERERIQQDIRETNKKRQDYIKEKSQSNTEDKNLKNSIQKSIEKQAKKKGYKVKN